MLAGSGTPGTISGATTPATPSPAIAASRAACNHSRGFTERRRLVSGSAESASTAPPTGSVAAPEKATTPLSPASRPGVVRPCTASNAAMLEKAVPTSTARGSPRRAPTTVRATAAPAAEPGADRDRQEMDLGTDLDLLRAEEVQQAGGDDGAGGDDHEQGKVPFTHQGVHTRVIEALKAA